MKKLLALLVLVPLLAAGCGDIPTAAPGQSPPPTPESYPPPTERGPLVTPTPRPTRTPTPSPTPRPTFPPTPTPLVVHPTPYAPEEMLPDGFPLVSYAVKRDNDPVQVWALRYEAGLLQEEMLLDLDPAALESRIGFHQYVGYQSVHALSYSPDGRYLAVGLQNTEGWGTTVIIRMGDGHVYLPRPAGHEDATGFLSWVPGSERFLWAGKDGANWGAMTIDGTDVLRFPAHDVREAVVSQNGGRVVFATSPSGGMWLGAVDTNGHRLTSYPVPDPLPGRRVRNLALSPEGTVCAFTWDQEITYPGAGQIWLMDADGANQRPVGPEDANAYDLAWSPDGRSIAFARWENPEIYLPEPFDPALLVSSLWLLDVPSGEERLLLSSEGQYAHWSPRWLPNGYGLVFLADRGGEVNIWLTRPDGTGLQQLTRQGGLAGEIAVLPR